jgi:hypothetical protein
LSLTWSRRKLPLFLVFAAGYRIGSFRIGDARARC